MIDTLASLRHALCIAVFVCLPACGSETEGSGAWSDDDRGFVLVSRGVGPVAPHDGCQGYNVTFTYTEPNSLVAEGCTDGTDQSWSRELSKAEQAELRATLLRLVSTNESPCGADGTIETLTVYGAAGEARAYESNWATGCQGGGGRQASPPFVDFQQGAGQELVRLLFALRVPGDAG